MKERWRPTLPLHAPVWTLPLGARERPCGVGRAAEREYNKPPRKNRPLFPGRKRTTATIATTTVGRRRWIDPFFLLSLIYFGSPIYSPSLAHIYYTYTYTYTKPRYLRSVGSFSDYQRSSFVHCVQLACALYTLEERESAHTYVTGIARSRVGIRVRSRREGGKRKR